MANAKDNPPPTAEPPADQLAERRRQRNAPQPRRPSRQPRPSENDGRTDAVRFDGATGLLGAGLGLDDVEDADDVLDSLSDSYTRADSARPEDHEPQGTATATETRDQTAVLAADDAIRERLHHHHEQNLAHTNHPSAPRGSAELPAENRDERPTARIQAKTPRRRQTPTSAQRLRSRRKRSLVAAAIVLAVVATLFTLDNLGTRSQPTQTAAVRSTAGSEATPALLYVHRVNDAATRNPNLLAGGRHRATARHAKRARHGHARHHVHKPTHTHRHAAPAEAPPSTPASQTAIATHSAPTETTPPVTTTTPAYTTPATTPASSDTPAATSAGSTSSSSGTSSSHSGSSSGGGGSAPAGPTGIGSAIDCNPQCS